MKDVFVQYVVRGNDDQTEGRGRTVDRETFVELKDALDCVKSGRWGVQGGNSGVALVERKWIVSEGIKWVAEDVILWGYRKDRDKSWGYGFMDLRDSAAVLDPEYVEYLRLKEKYGD